MKTPLRRVLSNCRGSWGGYNPEKGKYRGSINCNWDEVLREKELPRISLEFDRIPLRGKKLFFVPRRMDAYNPSAFGHAIVEIPFRDTTKEYAVNYPMNSNMSNSYRQSYTYQNAFTGDPRNGLDQYGVWSMFQTRSSNHGRFARQTLFDADSYELHLLLEELGYSINSSSKSISAVMSATEEDLIKVRKAISEAQMATNYMYSVIGCRYQLASVVDTALYYAKQPINSFLNPDDVLLCLMDKELTQSFLVGLTSGGLEGVVAQADRIREYYPELRSPEYTVFEMCRWHIRESFLKQVEQLTLAELISWIDRMQGHLEQNGSSSYDKNSVDHYWNFLTHWVSSSDVDEFRSTSYTIRESKLVQLLETKLFNEIASFTPARAAEMTADIDEVRKLIKHSLGIYWRGLCGELSGSGSDRPSRIRFSGRPHVSASGILNLAEGFDDVLARLYIENLSNPENKDRFLEYLMTMCYGDPENEEYAWQRSSRASMVAEQRSGVENAILYSSSFQKIALGWDGGGTSFVKKTNPIPMMLF